MLALLAHGTSLAGCHNKEGSSHEHVTSFFSCACCITLTKLASICIFHKATSAPIVWRNDTKNKHSGRYTWTHVIFTELRLTASAVLPTRAARGGRHRGCLHWTSQSLFSVGSVTQRAAFKSSRGDVLKREKRLCNRPRWSWSDVGRCDVRAPATRFVAEIRWFEAGIC